MELPIRSVGAAFVSATGDCVGLCTSTEEDRVYFLTAVNNHDRLVEDLCPTQRTGATETTATDHTGGAMTWHLIETALFVLWLTACVAFLYVAAKDWSG
jgi:hypothetical protein